MKHASLFLLLFFTVAVTNGLYAQAGPPSANGQTDESAQARRPNLLAELGLSPEQMQQIGRMNQARRPAMRDARRRLGDAAQNLDSAIYGNAVTDAEFSSRLKEFQAAEAELSRLRFESELSVRKILNPEQLVRFRELRRGFADERRKNAPERRMRRRDRGFPAIQDGLNRRPPSE
ncbi:MAG: periplasmic heavy metal sensor [Pyrinomonadaceae bacterium]